MREAASVTGLRLWAKFQPNPFSSFGGDAITALTTAEINNIYLRHDGNQWTSRMLFVCLSVCSERFSS